MPDQDDPQPPRAPGMPGADWSRELSRSPHPYLRRSEELPDRFHVSRSIVLAQGFLPPPELSRDLEFSDRDGRKRRKISSSSDSGTEADDERPHFLKSLPPALPKARKGLRAGRDALPDHSPSPLRTPSLTEDEYYRRLRQGSQVSAKNGDGKPPVLDQHAELLIKYRRRGQAEAARRICEAALCIAVLALCLPATRRLDHGVDDESSNSNPTDDKKKVLIHVSLVFLVYCFYPLMLLFRPASSLRASLLSPTQILATNDPAPLLYPVLLPLCITLCIDGTDESLLTTNLILSHCSLPAQVIPLHHLGMQWLVSLAPCLYTNFLSESGLGHKLQSDSAEHEFYTFIYPLQQSLVSCLSYLTTTSLLSTELRLLSTGLVNLLLFSTTPQATILKAMMWIGGVALFVTCRRILSWTVTLARIPSWRFRQVHHGPLERSAFFSAVDDCLGGILSKALKKGDDDDPSDDEPAVPKTTRRPRSRTPQMRYEVRELSASRPDRDSTQNSHLPKPGAVDLHGPSSLSSLMRSISPGIVKVRRRHTLPTMSSLPGTIRQAGIQLQRHSQTLRKKKFLTLTKSQAVVLKWLFAAYVYLMVLAIILVPLRSYIGHRALRGHEPFGWALGYLFGDLPSFRLQVVLWNLERWITLPRNNFEDKAFPCIAELVRQQYFGAANTRLLISGYCIVCIPAALLAVSSLSSVVEVDTRRKVFHALMVVMFAPTIFIDPTFVSLALALVLAIFLLLDLFRASQLPPLSKPLTYFLAPYVDGRDHKGPIVISPIFLLIGCAIPLWLSLAGAEHSGEEPFVGWEVVTHDVGMVAGVVCVGMGDAAASLIGRRYGRRKWIWSGGKSLEGSLAFAIAVVIGLLAARVWLLVGGWPGASGDTCWITLGKCIVAASGASLTEAVLTGGNDNVIVPVVLWSMVKGLRI